MFCLPEKKGGEMPQCTRGIATSYSGFPIDCLGEQARKISNSNHMIAKHLSTGHKCEQVAQYPKCYHETGCMCDVLG